MAKDPDVVFVEGKKEEGGTDSLLAVTSVLNEALKDVSGIFQMLVQAAMSNPIVGAALVLWINDILVQKKIIGDSAGLLVGTLVVSAAGVGMAGEIISDITQITKLVGGQTSGSLLTPSATTLVITGNQAQNQDQLNALLSMLTKK